MSERWFVVGNADSAAYVEPLRRAYGSFDAPKRFFVQDAMVRAPFAAVLGRLQQAHSVVDDTDVNCDVCFTYIMKCEQRLLVVKLSMVGPFAIVLSYGGDGFQEFQQMITGYGEVNEDEESVLSILADQGFYLVPVNHLERSVKIRLEDSSGEASLYAALFAPGAEFPWRS